MNKTFSIVTITKNALPELKRTFESLKNQSVKDFEWIVMDGASSDETKSWLASLKTQNFPIVWESEKDDGIADAWNKGIMRCAGEQVLILNAGDTYDSNMIEIFKKNICPNKITCANARLIDPIRQIQVGFFRAEPNKLWRGMHLPHNWCSVPKSFYDLYGGYPLMKYAMDFSWFHKLYKSNGVDTFQCIDIGLGNYHLGGLSDKNFFESFSYNRRVLIENGLGFFSAYFIFLLYVFKHYIKRFNSKK
jgi:glycosyltransferase involved in cell wall biosynthesis